MSIIEKYISDPGWWFSAFFIAIIASLIAGFLKDILTAWLSKTSTWFVNVRVKSIEKRKRRVSILVNNSSLLIIEAVRVTALTLGYALMLIIFMIIPIWNEVMYASPSMRAWMGVGQEEGILLTKIAIIIIGSIEVIAGFHMSQRDSIFVEALRIYRQSILE
jgi:hypothetical protein